VINFSYKIDFYNFSFHLATRVHCTSVCMSVYQSNFLLFISKSPPHFILPVALMFYFHILSIKARLGLTVHKESSTVTGKSGNVYKISSDGTCDCPDFRKYCLPCKHVFALLGGLPNTGRFHSIYIIC
jgi:hypothetical protein